MLRVKTRLVLVKVAHRRGAIGFKKHVKQFITERKHIILFTSVQCKWIKHDYTWVKIRLLNSINKRKTQAEQNIAFTKTKEGPNGVKYKNVDAKNWICGGLTSIIWHTQVDYVVIQQSVAHKTKPETSWMCSAVIIMNSGLTLHRSPNRKYIFSFRDKNEPVLIWSIK